MRPAKGVRCGFEPGRSQAQPSTDHPAAISQLSRRGEGGVNLWPARGPQPHGVSRADFFAFFDSVREIKNPGCPMAQGGFRAGSGRHKEAGSVRTLISKSRKPAAAEAPPQPRPAPQAEPEAAPVALEQLDPL